MAALIPTALESTPAGTTNVGGIINGNWTRLNQIFDAALSSADAMFNQFVKALVRNATLPTDAARLEWDAGNTRLVWRAGYALLTYAATVNLDFAGARLQKIPLTGPLTITVSNMATGREIETILVCDGTPRALTFPGSWLWLTAVPTTMAASKNALLKLRSTGSTAGAVFASYSEQP